LSDTERLDRFERGLEMLLQNEAKLTEEVRQLTNAVASLAQLVADLAKIVHAHEKRLERLEDDNQ
jgi:hypothetical protein